MSPSTKGIAMKTMTMFLSEMMYTSLPPCPDSVNAP